MFKYFLFILSLVSCAVSANSLIVNTKYGNYNRVACDSTATRCIAVGIGDLAKTHTRIVIRSLDAGKTWSDPVSLAAMADESLYDTFSQSIACDSSGISCVIASVAKINNRPTPITYRTEDGGLSWSEPQRLSIPKGTDELASAHLLLNLSADESGTHYKLSAAYEEIYPTLQLLYRSKDAGKTWVRYKKSLPSHIWMDDFDTLLPSIACGKTGKHCILAGYTYKSSFSDDDEYLTPLIYYTENAGASWSKPVFPEIRTKGHYGGLVIQIACDDTGLICTALGAITNDDRDIHFITTTTTDGGKTWHKKVSLAHSGEDIAFYDLNCDASGKICSAVGNELVKNRGFSLYKPVIYTTSNVTKQAWEKLENNYPLSSTLTGIACNETGTACVAVGNTAKIEESRLRATRFVTSHKNRTTSN